MRRRGSGRASSYQRTWGNVGGRWWRDGNRLAAYQRVPPGAPDGAPAHPAQSPPWQLSGPTRIRSTASGGANDGFGQGTNSHLQIPNLNRGIDRENNLSLTSVGASGAQSKVAAQAVGGGDPYLGSVQRCQKCGGESCRRSCNKGSTSRSQDLTDEDLEAIQQKFSINR